MAKVRAAKFVGRKRRGAGWALVVLGIVVAAVWVASGWYWVSASTRSLDVMVFHGELHLVGGRGLYPNWPRVKRGDGDFRLLWWYPQPNPLYDGPATSFGVMWFMSMGYTTQERWVAGGIVWPLPPLIWISAGVLLRSGFVARRRAVSGACLKCGYSRAGLAGGANCPECGRRGTHID